MAVCSTHAIPTYLTYDWKLHLACWRTQHRFVAERFEQWMVNAKHDLSASSKNKTKKKAHAEENKQEANKFNRISGTFRSPFSFDWLRERERKKCVWNRQTARCAFTYLNSLHIYFVLCHTENIILYRTTALVRSLARSQCKEFSMYFCENMTQIFMAALRGKTHPKTNFTRGKYFTTGNKF